jgi:trans-aconitate 2-methyltransferase
MDNKDSNRQWDAEIYHNISNIQEKWGRKVINHRKWHGNEIVMDAGCRTGRVTKLLAGKVSRGGMVYAVDIDPYMIQQSQKDLAGVKSVIVIQSNLVDVDLPRKEMLSFLMQFCIGF